MILIIKRCFSLKRWLFLCMCSLTPISFTQADTLYGIESIPITKVATVDIRVDGKLDEPVWNQLPVLEGLQVVEPDTLQPAQHTTQLQLFYDNRGMTIGIRAEQPAETLLARLSSRDKEINRDGVIVYLDTSGEGRYGYFFGVNLGGTLIDGAMLPERQLSALWDGPWSGAAQATNFGYTVEMFLPWSMLAMPTIDSQQRTMAIALTRRTAFRDETWGWPPLPDSQPRFMLGFQPISLTEFNTLASRGLTFYPSMSATQNRIRSETDTRVGTDIYWRPGSHMQLSATLLPDFGFVESDDVIINLTAYETFFPEKRPFFLEGNEIFITSPRSVVRAAATSTGARPVPNTFSLEPTTLLNTRRIGGAPRPPQIPSGVTVPDYELSKPTELLAATKVTGQNGGFRYGVLLAKEEDSEFYGRDSLGDEITLPQDGRDFGVVRLLYEDVAGGRRAIGMMSTAVTHSELDAYTNGIDLHYVSTDRRLVGDVQLMQSSVDDVHGYGGYFDVSYSPRQGTLHRYSFDYLNDELDVSDLGFLRRNDVVTNRYTFNKQSSASERFRFVNNNITATYERNTDDYVIGASLYYRNTLTLHNRNQLNTTTIYRPARWDDRTTYGNGNFRVHEGGLFEITYGTDTSKMISVSGGVNTSSEALGDWSYIARGGVTYKPNDRYSLDVNFMYRRANDWLVYLSGNTLGTYDAIHIQPSIDMSVFFTARQQLQFSLQWSGIKADATALYNASPGYNDLQKLPVNVSGASPYDFTISRLSAQIRYRWEIAPLSDLFVVYTRGGNVPRGVADEFHNLFSEALNDPIIDRIVVKLRYRFGS